MKNTKKPSSEYKKHIEYYKSMHEKGFIRENEVVSKDQAYDGKSTKPFVNIIKKIIELNECKSLLDYGCGKAKYYFNDFKTNKAKYSSLKEYWKVEVNLYDPCYKPYNKLINKKVDISICIDVLEHIPKQDISWVLKEFFSLTKKIVFLNVACYEAKAILPDGKNAHINVQSYSWWEKNLKNCSSSFPG